MKYSPKIQAQLDAIVKKKREEKNSVNTGLALMATEKTEEYKRLTDTIQSTLEEAFKIIETYRPKDGKTPVKGVEYFTKTEQKMFLQTIYDALVERIPTHQEVLADILPRVQVIKGDDGVTPSEALLKGLIREQVDSFDVSGIVRQVRKELQAEKITMSAILKELDQKGGVLEKMREEYKTLFNRGQAFKMRGGGDTVKAGTNITITVDANGNKVISSTGGSGGGSLTQIAITGTIDDSNVTFTSATQPDVLVINGALYAETGGAITWTYLAGTITLSSPVGTGGSIFGLTTDSTASVVYPYIPTGTVNGSNTAFTATSNAPKSIVADGVTYFTGNGYTLVGLDITMDIAPTSYIYVTA